MTGVALTRFYLEVDGMRVEGEGVVTVTGAPDADPAALVGAFLASLDPAVIEQVAMNRQGWGDKNLAAEIIDVLRDVAAGKPLT